MEDFGAFLRTSVRPIVTFAFVGGIIYAAVTQNEFALISLTSLGGPLLGFWFNDRSREREAQQMMYGQANEDHMRVQAELMREMNGQPSEVADGPKKPERVPEAIGYALPSNENAR